MHVSGLIIGLPMEEEEKNVYVIISLFYGYENSVALGIHDQCPVFAWPLTQWPTFLRVFFPYLARRRSWRWHGAPE